VATVGAVVLANAIPVLAEVDDSYCLDPEDIERRITPRTRLIVAVHMAGAVCEMDRILEIAQRQQVPVLEDCAQANGGQYRGRSVGTFGTLGMFSLQWNKNATAGEGGLLVTNDPALHERLVAAHDLGIPWIDSFPRYTGPASLTWGAGRRMSELVGAVASVQLRKLPRIVNHMRRSKRRIKARLAGLPGLEFRRLNDPEGDTGAFLIFRLPRADQALRAAEELRAGGLGFACRLSEYGMHAYFNLPQLVGKVPLSPAGNPWDLPANRASQHEYGRGACPRSDDLFERSILVPIPSRLTLEQERAGADLLARTIREALQ
jgi:8-amino-3,8-dideoxy-alpha-D-manno-octulosonate transaminase